MTCPACRTDVTSRVHTQTCAAGRLGATPETCPHELSGATHLAHLRRAQLGETPTHISQCVRCQTKVHVVLDPGGK